MTTTTTRMKTRSKPRSTPNYRAANPSPSPHIHRRRSKPLQNASALRNQSPNTKNIRNLRKQAGCPTLRPEQLKSHRMSLKWAPPKVSIIFCVNFCSICSSTTGSTRPRPILPRSLESDNEPPIARPSQSSARLSHSAHSTRVRSTSKNAKAARSPFPSPPPRRVTRTYSSRKKKKQEAPLPIPGVDYLLSSSPLPPDDVGEAMRDLLDEAFHIGNARFDEEFPLVSQGKTLTVSIPSTSILHTNTLSRKYPCSRIFPFPSTTTTSFENRHDRTFKAQTVDRQDEIAISAEVKVEGQVESDPGPQRHLFRRPRSFFHRHR